MLAIDWVAGSCGYAVPIMEFAQERDLLTQWAERRTPEGLVAYHGERNGVSVDGLPALTGVTSAPDVTTG